MTRLVPVAIVALFLVVVGRGLDFGFHWDEGALVDKVEWSVANGGILLPPTYDWPSSSFWVALAALTPELVGATGVTAQDFSSFEARLLAHVQTSEYQMRLRWCFAVLTSLSIVWVFAASRALGGGAPEATVAAAVLASAWEPAYHARFAVPDGLLMQFGALTLLCMAHAAQRPSSRWTVAAAAVAGLAVGTKYSAWPLLIPIAWIAAAGAADWTARVRRIAIVALASGAAFLVSTPGAVLMPARFAQAIVLQLRHYATGHGVHTIDAGVEHLWRMVEYAMLELLSPYATVAAPLAGVAVAGAVAIWRQSPAGVIAVAAFPLLYVLYFSLQRVMIVRNLIILAPFLALAAARGVAWLASVRPQRAWRAVPYALVAAAVAVNATFAVQAAASVRARHQVDLLGAARHWLEQSDVSGVGLSPKLEQALDASQHGDHYPPDVQAQHWLTFLGEPVCGEQLPANVRGLITLVAGPLEVNVGRYPDWAGDKHLVVVDLAKLRRYGRCGAAG